MGVKEEDLTSDAGQSLGLSSVDLAVTEHAPSPMALVEGSTRIVRYVNGAFRRLMKRPMEQLVGRPLDELLPENGQGVAMFERVFRTGKTESFTEQEVSLPYPVFRSYTIWPVRADERFAGVMIQVTDTAKLHGETVAMNEALMLGSLRQHELAEASEKLNAQLRTEIAERERTETALRESEGNYRTLFDSIDEGFCTIEVLFDENEKSVDYRFLEVNPAFERQTGIENAPGKRMREIAPHHEEHWFEIYGQIALTGEPLRFQNDARELHRSYDVYAFRVGAPRDRRVAILFNDISERSRTEEALRASEERFRAMVTQTRSGIVQTDLNGQIIFVNDRFCEITRYSRADLLRLKMQDITEREDLPQSLALFQRLIERDEPFVIEKRYRCKDDTVVWVENNVTPIRDAQGEPQAVLAVCLDITERKGGEKELRESRERYRLLVEGAPDYAMFLIDPQNTITYWSTGAERVFGWEADEAIGRNGNFIFTPEDRSKRQAKKELARALREGYAPDRRWHLRKDGHRIWIDGVMRRLDHADGNLRGFAKIARDATELHTAEDELRNARDELEQRVIDRTKVLMATNTELERTMAQRQQLERELLEISEREKRRIGEDLHDMVCQELAATALFLKASAKRLAEECPKAAKTLEESAQTVNRNVGTARELARGLQAMELTAVGFTNALHALVDQAGENGKIRCRFEAVRGEWVSDDITALHLYRIVQEAITNAIKHSEAKNVLVTLERNEDCVYVKVRDDGKGFMARPRRKGLGLHMMRYRANALGGELKIERGRKGGTEITCAIPTRR